MNIHWNIISISKRDISKLKKSKLWLDRDRLKLECVNLNWDMIFFCIAHCLITWIRFYNNDICSFLIHRSLIFPFLIRGGKPTPFIPFILAFAFCVLNGYLQGGYILKYADFGSKWMWNSRFYLGNFY